MRRGRGGGRGGGGAGGEAVPPRSDGQEAEQLERALLETTIPSGPLAAGVRVGFEARAGERLGRFDGDGREGMCTVGELERRARWMHAYAADMLVYRERGFSEPEARAAVFADREAARSGGGRGRGRELGRERRLLGRALGDAGGEGGSGGGGADGEFADAVMVDADDDLLGM